MDHLGASSFLLEGRALHYFFNTQAQSDKNREKCTCPDLKCTSHDLKCTQGCGNTMPDLSDLVPFHSGQVENFNLLVLGQLQHLYKVNKILYFIF